MQPSLQNPNVSPLDAAVSGGPLAASGEEGDPEGGGWFAIDSGSLDDVEPANTLGIVPPQSIWAKPRSKSSPRRPQKSSYRACPPILLLLRGHSQPPNYAGEGFGGPAVASWALSCVSHATQREALGRRRRKEGGAAFVIFHALFSLQRFLWPVIHSCFQGTVSCCAGFEPTSR